jgi:hypothetical protein
MDDQLAEAGSSNWTGTEVVLSHFRSDWPSHREDFWISSPSIRIWWLVGVSGPQLNSQPYGSIVQSFCMDVKSNLKTYKKWVLGEMHLGSAVFYKIKCFLLWGAILEFELRASYLLSKCSSGWAMPPALFAVVIFHASWLQTAILLSMLPV